MARPCNLLSPRHNIHSKSKVNIAGLEAKSHCTQVPIPPPVKGRNFLCNTQRIKRHIFTASTFHNSIFDHLSQFYSSYAMNQPNSGHQLCDTVWCFRQIMVKWSSAIQRHAQALCPSTIPEATDNLSVSCL